MLGLILTVLGALAVAMIGGAFVAPTKPPGSRPPHDNWP